MPQKTTSKPKPLGRTSGSLNAPIAAFTMAVLLCSYCVTSIRTARREAQDHSSALPGLHQRSSQVNKNDPSWIRQALEESRGEEGGKSGGRGDPSA